MIKPHLVESMAISYAHEDYNGLYELVWGLNSAHPKATPQERLHAAQMALGSLVARGLVDLFAADEPLQSPEPVPSSALQQVISDPESWLPPNERGSPHYCFATTAAGKRSYLAGKFTSL